MKTCALHVLYINRYFAIHFFPSFAGQSDIILTVKKDKEGRRSKNPSNSRRSRAANLANLAKRPLLATVNIILEPLHVSIYTKIYLFFFFVANRQG